MNGKEVAKWVSGFWAGAFLGALIACPAKEVSLPVSTVAAIVSAYVGWR